MTVEECPDCGKRGEYEGRVKISGRGVYRCPDGHAWQDAAETPNDCGLTLVRLPTPGDWQLANNPDLELFVAGFRIRARPVTDAELWNDDMDAS